MYVAELCDVVSAAFRVSKAAVSWQVRRDEYDLDEHGGEDAGGKYYRE